MTQQPPQPHRPWNPRTQLEAKLIARAWKDAAFAEQLRRDPKAAAQQALAEVDPQARLPDDLEVRVLEETPTTLYLVVPPKPEGPEAEQLSDDELEAVAGGNGTIVTCFTKGCISGNC
jgi:hypothetical protein